MRTGLDHLAFTVDADELDTWQQRLNEAGIATSPPALSALGEPLIVMRDPDGIQLQMYGRRTAPVTTTAQPTESDRARA
jgi:catechol-2,3-dioxygenase